MLLESCTCGIGRFPGGQFERLLFDILPSQCRLVGNSARCKRSLFWMSSWFQIARKLLGIMRDLIFYSAIKSGDCGQGQMQDNQCSILGPSLLCPYTEIYIYISSWSKGSRSPCIFLGAQNINLDHSHQAFTYCTRDISWNFVLHRLIDRLNYLEDLHVSCPQGC